MAKDGNDRPGMTAAGLCRPAAGLLAVVTAILVTALTGTVQVYADSSPSPQRQPASIRPAGLDNECPTLTATVQATPCPTSTTTTVTTTTTATTTTETTTTETTTTETTTTETTTTETTTEPTITETSMTRRPVTTAQPTSTATWSSWGTNPTPTPSQPVTPSTIPGNTRVSTEGGMPALPLLLLGAVLLAAGLLVRLYRRRGMSWLAEHVTVAPRPGLDPAFQSQPTDESNCDHVFSVVPVAVSQSTILEENPL
jgi:hypothetical protein